MLLFRRDGPGRKLRFGSIAQLCGDHTARHKPSIHAISRSHSRLDTFHATYSVSGFFSTASLLLVISRWREGRPAIVFCRHLPELFVFRLPVGTLKFNNSFCNAPIVRSDNGRNRDRYTSGSHGLNSSKGEHLLL